MADRLSSLLPELQLYIMRFLSAEDVDILCSISRSTHSICTSEEMSKYLLTCIYSFVTPEKFVTYKLVYNSAGFLVAPHRETYSVVRRRIMSWCRKFFAHFAVCNTRYMREDLMLQDLQYEVCMFAVGYDSTDDDDLMEELVCGLLNIISGLGDLTWPASNNEYDLTAEKNRALHSVKELLYDFQPCA